MESGNIESFYFKETIDGFEHDYRITMNDTHYDIEHDGKVIGSIVHDTVWQQLTGVPLSQACIDKIGERIESQYD